MVILVMIGGRVAAQAVDTAPVVDIAPVFHTAPVGHTAPWPVVHPASYPRMK